MLASKEQHTNRLRYAHQRLSADFQQSPPALRRRIDPPLYWSPGVYLFQTLTCRVVADRSLMEEKSRKNAITIRHDERYILILHGSDDMTHTQMLRLAE